MSARRQIYTRIMTARFTWRWVNHVLQLSYLSQQRTGHDCGVTCVGSEGTHSRRKKVKKSKQTRRTTQPWDCGPPCDVNSCVLSSLQQWDVTKPPTPVHHLPRITPRGRGGGGEIPSDGSDSIGCRPPNIPPQTISLICPSSLSPSLTSSEFHLECVSFCFVKRRQRDRFLVKTLFLQASFAKDFQSVDSTQL